MISWVGHGHQCNEWQVRLLESLLLLSVIHTRSLATPTTVIISQWWRNPGMMRLYWGAPLTLTRRQVPPSVDLNIGSLLSWAWVTTHTALSGVNNWDSLWNTGHLLPLVLTWTRVANNVWNLSQTIFLNVTIDWSFMALISSALFVWCILVESVNMDLG